MFDRDFAEILSRVTPSLHKLEGAHLMITGAAGFIGSYLMDFMAYANANYFAQPCHVLGVDNWAAASRKPALAEHIAFVASVEVADYDYCIHAASIASPKYYLAKPLETLNANVGLTERILRQVTAWGSHNASPVKRLLYLSSCEIYGDPTVVPTPETYRGNVSTTSPRAVYDESKRYAETLCMTYHRQHGVPVVIARPFNIYGPGEALDDGRLVPQLMKSALTGCPFTIYGDGLSTRSVCYISDAVVQLLALLLDGRLGEAYNVGDGESEFSIGAFADIGRTMFPDLKVEYVFNHETLVDAPTRRRPDTTKILSIAKAPIVELAEGLRRTYDYYKGQE